MTGHGFTPRGSPKKDLAKQIHPRKFPTGANLTQSVVCWVACTVQGPAARRPEDIPMSNSIIDRDNVAAGKHLLRRSPPAASPRPAVVSPPGPRQQDLECGRRQGQGMRGPGMGTLARA